MDGWRDGWMRLEVEVEVEGGEGEGEWLACLVAWDLGLGIWDLERDGIGWDRKNELGREERLLR